LEPLLRETIGTNIRSFAKLRGLTLDAVADFAGVSRRQLYSLLAGEHDVTVGWLAKVAEALEVETWKLLRPRPAPKR
jgi:transcriptional regulator with XRE-family HTH domain